jgi:GTP-binding protein
MGDHAARGGEALSQPAEALPGAAELEAGRLLFAAECRFLRSVARLEQLPDPGLPEVAFAGRSNVGKSSLLNALTGRKSLAHVSQTPGRTRALNFFELGGRILLVDLPGYGYARAAKTEVAAWQRLLRAYLRGRPSLRRLCLLIDARVGLKASDRETMDELDQAAVSYQLVLTKADKWPPAARAPLLASLAAELAKHPAAHPEVAVTSAQSGEGIPELRAAIAALASASPFR